MSFSATFGSFGDFVTIVILIKDVIKTLDDGKGSSSEYHQTIRELLSLERAFVEVGIMCQDPDPTSGLYALTIQVRAILDQCKTCIEKFLRLVHRYTRTLRPNGSGNAFRDFASKMKWQFEKAEVERFQGEIARHSCAMNMLLILTNTSIFVYQVGKIGNQCIDCLSQKSHEIGIKSVKDHLEKIYNHHKTADSDQNADLDKLQEQLNETNKRIADQDIVLADVSDRW